MKKLLVAVVFALLLCGRAWSQSENGVIQILMPKTAFIGDKCELKYVFRSDADLFADKISGKDTSSLELETDWPSFNTLADRCFIQKAVIEHMGYEYTLTVSFIPWRAGILDIPSIDLAALIRQTLKEESFGVAYAVDPEPVVIHSISERLKIDSLRPAAGPMVVPGTVFILILLALLFLVLAALVIYLILKLPVISSFLTETKAQRKARKLNNHTIRLLKKLLRGKTKSNDELFCQKLPEIIRTYLCNRFDSSFAVVTTGRIYGAFEKLSSGEMSERQEQAVLAFTEVLQRCDYIRFAKGSADSRRQPASLYETVLAYGERELLVKRIITAIGVFEEEVE